MALTTSNAAQVLKDDIYHSKFLDELRANLVLAELGLVGFAPKGQGTVCSWLSLADMTAAGVLTEGKDPTSFGLTATRQSATLSQKGASVEISDLMQDASINGYMEAIMERLGRNAALTIDTIIRDANLTAGGTAQYAGTAVARNSVAQDSSFYLDVAEVREATRYLEGNNVPTFADGFYVGVVHPYAKYDLQGDSNWTNLHMYVDKGISTLYKGEVGELYGVRFKQSTQCFNSAMGSASATLYQTYIMGKDHFGISKLYDPKTIIKNPHPASDLDLYSTVGWKAAFATKELDSKKLVRIEGAATL